MLAVSDHTLIAPTFMLAAGLSAGGGATIVSALWAEVYGVGHLGAIRALATALAVLSSAASPVLFGALFDAGFSLQTVLGGSAAYVVIGGVLLALVAPRCRPATA